MKNLKYIDLKVNIIFLLMFISIITLSILFLFSKSKQNIEYVSNRFYDKTISLEQTLNNEISIAKHIIYGLGLTISENKNHLTEDKLIQIVNNFDRDINFEENSSNFLSDIVFVSKSQENLAINYNSKTRRKKKYMSFAKCIQEIGKEPFKVYVGSIRIDPSTKTSIIPIRCLLLIQIMNL